MRGAYLKAKDFSQNGGQRGGVGNDYDNDSHGYELEIGHQSHASEEMLALCQLHDEIIELLQKSRSPLANLVLRQYMFNVARLKEMVSESQARIDGRKQ